MSKVEVILTAIFITIGILVGMLVSLQLKGLNVEVPPVEVPDYSQSLEALEGQVDYLKKKMEEMQGRIQDIRDRLDSLLETFDVADTYTITGYAPLDPSAVYGLDYIGNPSVTASGDKPIPGQTVAADKSIPFGTRVWIEGVGVRTVNDRGGAIKRGRLDLCMETRDEALQFGRQRRKVIILKEG
jgi:3D (Asp-Asp-Asp) domain-containing protein